MRKLLLSLATLFLMAGLVIGAEMVLVKFDKDKNEATLKDGDKEVTGKLSKDTKVTVGDKEGTLEDVTKRWSSDKAVGKKYDVTIKDGAITEVKIKGKK
jgi:hypothetical protein